MRVSLKKLENLCTPLYIDLKRETQTEFLTTRQIKLFKFSQTVPFHLMG